MGFFFNLFIHNLLKTVFIFWSNSEWMTYALQTIPNLQPCCQCLKFCMLYLALHMRRLYAIIVQNILKCHSPHIVFLISSRGGFTISNSISADIVYKREPVFVVVLSVNGKTKSSLLFNFSYNHQSFLVTFRAVLTWRYSCFDMKIFLFSSPQIHI
jgi:hypothetical protein